MALLGSGAPHEADKVIQAAALSLLTISHRLSEEDLERPAHEQSYDHFRRGAGLPGLRHQRAPSARSCHCALPQAVHMSLRVLRIGETAYLLLSATKVGRDAG